MDFSAAVGAVRREVVSTTHDGKPARMVVVERTYEATIEDVWDALTNAERMPRWFLPVSGDLKLGGRYQLEGNAGGTITACDPPGHLAVTWEFGGEVTWVEVHLTSPGDGTMLRLEHIAHVDDRWKEFGPGAVGIGWDLSLLALAEHLETGEQVVPDLANSEALAFMPRAATTGAEPRSPLAPHRRRRRPRPRARRPRTRKAEVHAFDVLGDPVRRRILELLVEDEWTSGAITEIVRDEFGISQPAVSQHLRVLRDSGFATVRADGAHRFYTLRGEPLHTVDAWLAPFRDFWEQRLDALGTELKRGRRSRPRG